MPKAKKQIAAKAVVNSKNNALRWIMGGVLAAFILLSLGLGVGWYLGHQQDEENPYQVLKSYESSRHEFIVKSSQLSVEMSSRAITKLKNKDVQGAIEDCKTAIDLFPINAKPYILLTKLYLMTGQEKKMYETLSLAGRSYPNFNNILDVIDDADLDRITLDEPQGNIYLANFPENKQTAISYMFDDGESNVYKALPTFEKYGYRCTIPVVAAFVADTSNDPFWGSWGQWKDAARRGFEIANHSMYHRDSKMLHGKDFDVAIDQAKQMIEQNVGQTVTSFVFPHDSYTDEAVSRALRLHKAIRTPEFLQSVYPRTVDIVIGGPYVSLSTGNRLVDIGIKRKLWLVFKCHGVTNKRSLRSFKAITPEFLEGNLAYIHAKDQYVWVDTFAHIFDYMSLRTHTNIETTNTTSNSMDFVLHNTNHNTNHDTKLTLPMTVIIKATITSAQANTKDGHNLKAWACDADKLCVDVDNYDEFIHVQWK